jgi:two-component system NarL family sensor kinase
LITTNGRAHRSPGRMSVAASVTQFAVAGLVATLALAAFTGVLARRAALEQGTRAFENLAWIAATALEPALDADPTRPPAARADLGDLVSALVAADIVLRVQVLDASGRVLWSDDPRVVGEETPLRPEVHRALETGSLVSEIHDAQDPENRAERDQGPTLEAYVGVRDVNGTPLLLNFYERYDEVTTIAWHTWWEFAPAALGALVLLQLVQVPLAWRLARRLRRSQEAEGTLLHAAVDASEAERLRIAGEVHDHVVQDLSGLAYDLDAARLQGSPRSPADAELMGRTAKGVRQTVTDLRELLVSLMPTRVPSGGLEPTLRVLGHSLRESGIHVTVRAQDTEGLSEATAALLYRCAQEALRNVSAHSRASSVEVTVDGDEEVATLTIDDDGRGFDDARLDERNAAGHLGLRTLGELLVGSGGTLTVSSAPGQGTRLTATVPRSTSLMDVRAVR